MSAAIKKVLLQKQVNDVLYNIYSKTSADLVDYTRTVQGGTDVETTVAAELAYLLGEIKALPTTQDLQNLETRIIGTLGENENLAEAFDTLKEISEFLDGAESIQSLTTLINDVGHASDAGVEASGLHALVESLRSDVDDLISASGTNVSKTKTVEGATTTAANGHLYLDGVDTVVYDDAALGAATDTADAAGTSAWSRIKNAENDIDTLQGAVGAATDAADAAGTTAWARLKNAETDVDNLQAALGASTDAANDSGTTAWSRIKALEEADGTNVSKTKTVEGTPTNAANGHLYLDGVDTTVYDDATVWAALGHSTDTADSTGTTAWARLKNAETDVDNLQAAVGTAADAANASGTTAWARLKNAEGDIDTLQAAVGASTDTADAAGTTAWSRIKAIEGKAAPVQFVATSPATPEDGVLYMVDITA